MGSAYRIDQQFLTAINSWLCSGVKWPPRIHPKYTHSSKLSMSHKERKTQFVSDLVGGSTLDIYTVTSISALSYLVWCVLKKKTALFEGVTQRGFSISVFVDFLLNWNNLLLSTTIYANSIPLLIVLNILPLIPVVLFSSSNPKKDGKASEKKTRKAIVNLKTITVKQFLPFKTFITVYRAQMMVITCICIMAVDFQVFPRRFGKVETWGTSLMDLGVGSFVFSMGLISERSFLRQLFESKYSYSRTIYRSLKNSIPIFVLGLIRLISVKSVDYHEHVTEYGQHWNFFFTLGCLPILNAIFSPIIMKTSPLLTSIMISIIYEYLLVGNGLLGYIIASPRDSLLSANREGILSLFGYFPIFLNGLALGASILPIVPLSDSLFKVGVSRESLMKAYSKGKGKVGISPLKAMFVLSLIFQVSYYIIDTCYIYSVSRRMANLLYVIWVSAYNCTFLFLYGIIEKLVWGNVEIQVVTELSEDDIEIKTSVDENVCDEYVPTSLTAVNTNSLVLFLVSNLLTGLINLTFNTIDAGILESMAILLAYEIALSGLSLVLYNNGVVLR